MSLGTIASAVGKGVFAGAAGTMAMTAVSTIEMKLRGREQSTVPAKAVEEVFDIEPESEEAEQRLNNLAHFGYGAAWGVPRGVLRAVGLNGPLATGLHFAAVWGAALAMLPGLKVAPPPKEWGGRELAIDALHHAVYAAAAGAAYEWLDRSDRNS